MDIKSFLGSILHRIRHPHSPIDSAKDYCARLLVRHIPPATVLRLLSEDTQDDSKILVSVIIPVRNGIETGLERLLLSLRNQTHKNIEIVAIDTESTDGTVALLEKFGAKILNIALKDFRHDLARNRAVAEAKGEYLLLTVNDACFDQPDWISVGLKSLRIFEGDSYCSSQRVDKGAEPYAQILAYNFSAHVCPHGGMAIYGGNNGSVAAFKHAPQALRDAAMHVDSVNHLVRRDTFQKIGLHRHTCEDMDFGKRLLLGGGRFIHSGMSSVLHYHAYRNYRKYFTRVLVDSEVVNDLTRACIKPAENDNVDLQVYAAIKIYQEILSQTERARANGTQNIILSVRNPDKNAASADADFFLDELTKGLLRFNSGLMAVGPQEVAGPARDFFTNVLGLSVANGIQPADIDAFVRLRDRFLVVARINSHILARHFDCGLMPLDEYRHLLVLTFINVFACGLSVAVYRGDNDKSANARYLRPLVWQ